MAQGIAAEDPSAELHADQPFNRRLARLVEDQAKRSGHDPTLSATTGVFARGSQIVEVWKSTPEAPARALFELVTHPALLGPIAELLGGPELCFHRGLCRPKLPGVTDAGFPWHQDSQYFDTKSPNSKDAVNVEAGWSPSTADMPIVGVWVPLVDADVRSGCLQFIEGSHRWGLLDGARDGKNNMQTHEDFWAREGARPVAVPAKRGDVILFSNLVFHGSEMSNSDDVRWALDWRCHASPFAARFVDPDAGVVSESELAATRWWATEGWWSDGQPGGSGPSGRWEAWAPWAASGRSAL